MSADMVAAMLAALILTIVIPLGVMCFLHRRGGAWSECLTGAGTFIAFAMILEPIMHSLVLRSGIGGVMQGNIWLYGLYGGLAAGIFEETGRLLAFRFILKSPKRITALSYGIGHGGCEAFLLLGLTMASNLVLGLMYANGETLAPELAGAVEALLATPLVNFFWGGFERLTAPAFSFGMDRLTAMTLHMSLSVLVFASARTEKRGLFPAAVLLHALVDFAAVTSNAYLPVAATEGGTLLLTLLIAAWAAKIYKNLPKTGENT